MAQTKADRLVGVGIVPPQASELVAQFGNADQADIAALSALTVTATTGTLPTATSSVTIANAAVPTVLELQDFCVKLNAKINAIRIAIQG
jgi:hypothetical protein